MQVTKCKLQNVNKQTENLCFYDNEAQIQVNTTLFQPFLVLNSKKILV